MPLKFWKKEKREEREGKEKARPKEKEKGREKPKEKKAKEEAKATEVPPAAAAAPKPPAAEVRAEVTPKDPDESIQEIHRGLVDLGLTIPATKDIFAKRIVSFAGGREAFADLYASEPYKVATRALAEWLGIRAAPDFDPERFLGELNTRLSSFGISVGMSDLSWLDQELALRKAHLRLEGRDRIVRFKDARDFVKGVNDLLAAKNLAFLELETWSKEHSFLMARNPDWSKLASTELVVVKDSRTATGGECGDCGGKVGKYWNDCLTCGAIFA